MSYVLDNAGNYVARLPSAFIIDCIECDCDVGDTNAGVWTGNQNQLEELISRARFYDGGTDYKPMERAAKRLLQALNEEGLYGMM